MALLKTVKDVTLTRGLSDLRCERLAFHADEISPVEQLFEHVVVQGLVLAWTQFVAVEVDLQRAFAVLQFCK